MTAHPSHAPSGAARSLHWLLDRLVEEAPGVLSVAVVSSDGLPLLSSDPGRHRSPSGAGQLGPRGSSADLATIVSGLASLTFGAAELMDAGRVKQTVISMREGSLCIMAIGDGSLLGVHAAPECDMSLVAYHMAFFVSRAGRVLTPEVRSELRRSTAPAPLPGSVR
jgi:predicted regulator of Ras-like GTPase activity (Roadblock/LC7/MglB family)